MKTSCAVFFMIVCTSICYAQAPLQAPAAQQTVSVAPAADGKPIGDVLADWAKAHGQQLVMEPSLKAAVKIESPTASFEAGLDSALAPYKNIVWRKLYLREGMKLPQAARLSAMMRTMNADEAVDMIVQDQMNAKISSFVKEIPAPKGLESKLADMQPAFSKKLVYVVFSSVPTWASAGGLNLKNLAANPNLINENTLNEQSAFSINKSICEAIARMPEADRGKALRSIGEISGSVNPVEMANWMVDAWKLMDATSEAAKQAAMRHGEENIELMLQDGMKPITYTTAGTLDQANADLLARSELRGQPIAAVLAECANKFHANIIVDPSLFDRIKLDPNANTVEQALTLALKPYPNISWRKVYLRSKTNQPKPYRLAAMARTMALMEATGLINLNARSGKMSCFAKSVDVPSNFEASLSSMNPPFSPLPLYIVYNAKPNWASADGSNLLDVTADPSGVADSGMTIDAMKAMSNRLYTSLAKMEPTARARALKGLLESLDNCEPRTRYMMFKDSQASNAVRTPEEQDVDKQQMTDFINALHDKGIDTGTPPSR